MLNALDIFVKGKLEKNAVELGRGGWDNCFRLRENCKNPEGISYLDFSYISFYKKDNGPIWRKGFKWSYIKIVVKTCTFVSVKSKKSVEDMYIFLKNNDLP